ncbi:SDR family oxidoreductase [Streptomyces sp. NPDC005820]|uniref:SDR family NAD(P)-dependent oxidoreductase n=1 Tax=Streptomyces sp. NPDC005820 TaxID=3157069 RepID=UPI00340D47ED
MDPEPVRGTARHALVTGVSSGIGAAVTARLLAEGWTVTGMSRTPPSPRPGLAWLPADLSHADPLPETLRAVTSLDAVVHAAGLQRTAPLGRLSAGEGALMWQVHVQTACVLLDTVVDRLRDGGRIVLVGSRTMTGVPGKSQYAASKAALSALARSWAAELAPRRVTVNVVAPGPTDTPMLRDPGRARTPPVTPPLGRLIDPAEIAGLTSFLLGPDGRSVTGQTWVVCGGSSL